MSTTDWAILAILAVQVVLTAYLFLRQHRANKSCYESEGPGTSMLLVLEDLKPTHQVDTVDDCRGIKT